MISSTHSQIICYGQMEESATLDEVILENLEVLGYGR
jgi:hypothetical protein